MEKMWYYAQGGKEKQGPVPESQIKSMIAGGQLAPTDLVWSEGMAAWTPVSDMTELQTSPNLVPFQTQAPASTPTVSNTLPPGLLKWMQFVGVCTIIFGVLYCLSCVGIVVGVFIVISGSALVGAKSTLANVNEVNNELVPFFQKLKTYLVMSGIVYILSIVGTIIALLINFSLLAAALGGAFNR